MNQPRIRLAEKPQPVTESPTNQQSTKYAGFWIRALASIIDTFLCYIIIFALIFVTIVAGIQLDIFNINTDSEAESMGETLGLIYGLIVQALWWSWFESSKLQGTPGKKIFKLKVIDTDGRRISFGRAFSRYLCKWISAIALLIGFMMAGWTKQKQALHDKMVDTLVVKSAGQP